MYQYNQGRRSWGKGPYPPLFEIFGFYDILLFRRNIFGLLLLVKIKVLNFIGKSLNLTHSTLQAYPTLQMPRRLFIWHYYNRFLPFHLRTVTPFLETFGVTIRKHIHSPHKSIAQDCKLIMADMASATIHMQIKMRPIRIKSIV